MASRLVPRTIDELYAHALALEREAVARYHEYSRCVRRLGHLQLADTLEQLEREEREQIVAFERGLQGRELPTLSPWEYGCHFTGDTEEILKLEFPVHPRTAADALGLALAAERRAASFYGDVAENAEEVSVRAVAALMAVDEQRHVEQLERLLGRRPEPEHERRARRRHAARRARST